MDLVYSDGGRAAAGYKGRAGDCVVRAIAIAAQKPYQEVYYAINAFALAERVRRGRSSSEPQRCRANDVRGLSTNTRLGMGTDHAGWFRLPSAPKNGGATQGTPVVRLSRHLTAVIDGVIHDIYNPDRQGSRCVYGYFKPAKLTERRRDE